MKAPQPHIVTNFRTGTVSLRILIGAEEKDFEFHTHDPKDARAGGVRPMLTGADVGTLAVELEGFLRAMGYEPLTEHKT